MGGGAYFVVDFGFILCYNYINHFLTCLQGAMQVLKNNIALDVKKCIEEGKTQAWPAEEAGASPAYINRSGTPLSKTGICDEGETKDGGIL